MRGYLAPTMWFFTVAVALAAALLLLLGGDTWAQDDGGGSEAPAMSAPHTLVIGTAVDGDVLVRFTGSSVADSHEVQLHQAASADGAFTRVDSLTLTAEQDEADFGSQDGDRYYQGRLRSCDADGCTDWVQTAAFYKPAAGVGPRSDHIEVEVTLGDTSFEEGSSTTVDISVTDIPTPYRTFITATTFRSTSPLKWDANCSVYNKVYQEDNITSFVMTLTLYGCEDGDGDLEIRVSQTETGGVTEEEDVTVTAFSLAYPTQLSLTRFLPPGENTEIFKVRYLPEADNLLLEDLNWETRTPGGQWRPLTASSQSRSGVRDPEFKERFFEIPERNRYYRVQAASCKVVLTIPFRKCGSYSPWAQVFVPLQTPTPRTAPAPDDVDVERIDASTLEVSWDSVDDAAAYRLEQASDEDGPWSEVSDTLTLLYRQVSPLMCGERYYFRVSARGDGDPFSTTFGDPSDPEDMRLECDRAPGPSTYHPGTITQTSISFSWTAVTGAERYRVLFTRDGQTATGVTIRPSYTATGLQPDTEYTFNVSTRGDGHPFSIIYGSATQYAARTLEATPDPEEAPAPTRVTAGSPSRTAMTASWDSQDDIAAFKVEYATSSTGPFSISSQAVSGSSTSHRVTGLQCNTRYYFRVSARGDGDPYLTTFGDPSTVDDERTSECPTASAPTGLTTTALSTTRIDLEWDPVPHAEQYQVEYQVGSVTRQETSGDEEHTAGNLQPGTTYQFRVRTRGNGHPWSTAWGGWSSPEPGTTEAIPNPTINIENLAASIALDSTDDFSVQVNDLNTNQTYSIRIRTNDIAVAGLDGGCTSSSESHPLNGNIAGSVSETLKGCGIGRATITADLLENGSRVAWDTMAVQGIYPPPQEPTKLVESVSNEQVTLTWKAGKYATGYQVQQKQAGTSFRTLPFDSFTISITSAGDDWTAVIGGLSNGTTYTYHVRSTNPSGESGWTPALAAEPLDTLETPTRLSTKPAPFRRVEVSWGRESNHD